MTRPNDQEVVSLVLAIEEVVAEESVGVNSLRFLAREAARMIRKLRPDLAFKEEPEQTDGQLRARSIDRHP